MKENKKNDKERFNKWMSRIKIPWWVYRENVGGNNYRDLEKMLLKAYKLGIKHSEENVKEMPARSEGGSRK